MLVNNIVKLLETVFAAFDDVGRRKKVFKVETVGECYGKNNFIASSFITWRRKSSKI